MKSGPYMEHEGCVELLRRKKSDFGRDFWTPRQGDYKATTVNKMTARISSKKFIWASKSMDLVNESIIVLYYNA